MRLLERRADPKAQETLQQAGLSPLFARLYAARGVTSAAELGTEMSQLEPPDTLANIQTAAVLLARSIDEQQQIVIVADYDCDGATACAVGVRGLRALGARVDYIVPNRFEYGYGLTPEIVEETARRFQPHLIITVDNGIASVEGARRARALGIEVLITDHHLPGDELPDAACIVNPNQPRCSFPSKHLAGVGVMFYVLLALRAHMRQRGAFSQAPEPRLDGLLCLVALGTVADVVRLDANNRRLVSQGLQRIRAGRAQAGITALFTAAGREARSATAGDLGFALGPRINAAGRLADMSLGIECLLTDDLDRAVVIAGELDAINQARRTIETKMQDEALVALRALEAHGDPAGTDTRASLCLFDPGWHQGVVGILASRMKDRFHRPTFAFAPTTDGSLRGSGRSIAGLHLRDALDLVSKRHPTLIQRFGGHAMAAGLSIAHDAYPAFATALETAVSELLDPAQRTRTLEFDGPLDERFATPETARQLAGQVWGQGFAVPLFRDTFAIANQKLLKDKHLKLVLKTKSGRMFDAIWFNRTEPLPPQATLVYRLVEDNYRGAARLQLMVEALDAGAPGRADGRTDGSG